MIHDRRGVAAADAPGMRGLHIEAVSKSFGKGEEKVDVLDDISLEVTDGEFIAVIGPSGSGKSTLLNSVAGFIEPDRGTIRVDGELVTGPGPSRCVVFQEYAIFPFLTVRKNIEFGTRLHGWRGTREDRRRISDHYLELTGLGAFADALPKTLSGGMRQRVAIARAYAVDPAILLMDEPFAALDAQTRESMQEALLELNRRDRRTVLFVTHQVEEAIYLADRVVVMTRRPSRIAEVVQVPWGRDRDHSLKTTAEFVELRRHVEDLLRGGAAAEPGEPVHHPNREERSR